MEEPERLVRAALGDCAAAMSQKDINILSTCWLSGGNATIIKDALQGRLDAGNKLSLNDMALLADPHAYLSIEQFRHIMGVLSGRRFGDGSQPNGNASPNQDAGERWLSSREATLRVAKATGHGPDSALYAIIAYAKIGRVKSRALAIKEKVNDRSGRAPKVWQNVEVPIWFWEECTDYGSCALDWQSGVFAGRGFFKGSLLTVDLTGVEFNAAGIDFLDPPQVGEGDKELAACSGGLTRVDREYDEQIAGDELQPASKSKDAASGSETVQERNKGGRPPAEWWDDLWIEIFRQIWVGDLKPKVQADIENAMMNWAILNGHSPAISTIRGRARKLWDQYQEVEN